MPQSLLQRHVGGAPRYTYSCITKGKKNPSTIPSRRLQLYSSDTPGVRQQVVMLKISQRPANHNHRTMRFKLSTITNKQITYQRSIRPMTPAERRPATFPIKKAADIRGKRWKSKLSGFAGTFGSAPTAFHVFDN
jgi:hypothetical protein